LLKDHPNKTLFKKGGWWQIATPFDIQIIKRLQLLSMITFCIPFFATGAEQSNFLLLTSLYDKKGLVLLTLWWNQCETIPVEVEIIKKRLGKIFGHNNLR
jgi:hypothetical protein